MMCLARVRNGERAEILPQRFLTRPAENRFGLTVPVDNDSGLIELDKRIESAVDHGARHLLAVAQSFLHALHFSNVACDLRRADDVTGF